MIRSNFSLEKGITYEWTVRKYNNLWANDKPLHVGIRSMEKA